jgi:response regulator NasT
MSLRTRILSTLSGALSADPGESGRRPYARPRRQWTRRRRSLHLRRRESRPWAGPGTLLLLADADRLEQAPFNRIDNADTCSRPGRRSGHDRRRFAAHQALQATARFLQSASPNLWFESKLLKILIVDESPIRAAILEEGLREAGFEDVERIAETHNLLRRVYASDPDVILIDLENPSRDELEQMFQVSRAVRRPVAMFVDQSDTDSIQASVEAGVSAYIVDGLKKERIRSIVDLCVSRFNAFAKLRSELELARSDLQERKTIDRAKGILMKTRNLSEEEAYRLLRGVAMRESKRIAEIAQSVITASELLK